MPNTQNGLLSNVDTTMLIHAAVVVVVVLVVYHFLFHR